MTPAYPKYRRWAWFVGGLALGVVLTRLLLPVGGHAVVERDAPVSGESQLDDLPYDENANASAEVAAARDAARREGKFLMVTFGANWCLDCRTLYRHLHSEEVAAYARNLFDFVHVDVGKFNQNRELADELGVDLRRGIPVAIFFDPSGQVIGATNQGELEPARHYSSKQILRFMRDIAERSRIAAPDDVL